MSAAERVRQLLDERGVEWTEGIARPELTQVRIDGKVVKFHQWQPNTLKVSLFDITPEQAIAATLGPAARHPKPHEQWTTVLLPEIAWGLDDRWPDYLSVAHDAHGEWRVYVPEDTLGSRNCSNSERTGTCHDTGTFKSWGLFTCSNCSIVIPLNAAKDAPEIGKVVPLRFCPNCGRKVVDE